MPVSQTLEIKAGECITLPAGVKVTSLIANGAATISSSTCADLPPFSTYECYDFFFVINDDASGALHPADEIDIIGFRINGVDYPVSFPYSGFDNNLPDFSYDWNLFIPLWHTQVPLTIRFLGFTRTFDGEHRQQYKLAIKLLPELASTTYMLIQTMGFTDTPILIQTVETDDCTDTTTLTTTQIIILP